MTDYNSIEKLKSIIKSNLNNIDLRLKETIEIFISVRDMIRYKNSLLHNKKISNIRLLTTNNLFLIHELFLNIIQKNYISSFSLIRIIIENLYTISFLVNSSDYINEIYFDYSDLCLINIWDDKKVEQYEKKYSVKVNKNKDKQWIDQIKGNSKYNGFSYIKNEVNKLGNDYFDDWYKNNSNFIHSSISATRLNISLYLDDEDKYADFIFHFLYFIVYDLCELFRINEKYLKCANIENEEITKKMKKFLKEWKKFQSEIGSD